MEAKKKEQDKLVRVLKGLTGITEYEQPNSLQERVLKQHVLITQLNDPPSYFVLMLLRIANFTLYNDQDKSIWQFYLQYKGLHFCIRDWKVSTWSIDALEMSVDSERAMKIAEELRARIVKTSRNLEKLLQPELQHFIDKNDYALPNPYRHLRNLYSYFRDQVQETQDKVKFAESARPKDLDISQIKVIAEQKTLLFSPGEDLGERNVPDAKTSESNEELKKEREPVEVFLARIVDSHNKKLELERIASYNACAMVSFFFSYLEFLMDTLYIFFPVAGMTLQDFQEKAWRERFKTVFPVDKDRDIARIYRKLLEIRDGWRNVIEHGFRSKEESLLIPLPGLGLVPVSYTSASKAIHFAITPSPENGIQEALDVFSSFEAWAANNQRTNCVIVFAQYNNPIPLEKQRLQVIRKWMSSPETLKKALDAEEDELQSWLDQYQ